MARKPPDDDDRCTGTTTAGTRCTKKAIAGTDRCAHHSFKIPGRPSKCTPEVTARVVAGILEGNYLEVAAQLAGISKSTLHNWVRRAEDAEARAHEHAAGDLDAAELYAGTNPADWPYLDFLHAYKSAEAYAEARLLRQAQAGGFGWQAPMTVLERRHPSRWGRRAVLDHTHSGSIDAPGRVSLVVPEPSEVAEVVRSLVESGALAAAENTPTQEDPDA